MSKNSQINQELPVEDAEPKEIHLHLSDEVTITDEQSQRVEKQLTELAQTAQQEQTSLFPNIDQYSENVFGVTQLVKEVLDTAPDISEEEITTEETRRKQKAGSELKFEKSGKGLAVDMGQLSNLAKDLTDTDDLTSHVGVLRSARFVQDSLALFSYAAKNGSFRINDKLIDILNATGAYNGSKRIRQDRIKSFSQSIMLASTLSLRTTAPKFTDKNGRERSVGKYERFEQYFRLFGFTGANGGILWAIDRQGNKTYIKKIVGEIMPDIKNKGWLRGIVVPDGFFRLDAGGNDEKAIFLSSYLVTRFSQSQDETINGEPLKLDRQFLITEAHYQASDQANKSDASNKLERVLNRILAEKIIGDWCVVKTKKKEISTDDNECIYIYPPVSIIKSLKAKPEPQAKLKVPDHLGRFKRFHNDWGKTELARFMGCSTDEIEKYEHGEMKFTSEQIKKINAAW